MERHYFGDKKSRMVAVFREHVVAKIDDLIDPFHPQNGTKVARIVELACHDEETAQRLSSEAIELKR